MTTAEETARFTALTVHDRTLLVEAGAGSGKTALMAGRVTMMLLAGIEPRHIVAITFTEAAAGELLSRIREYLRQLQDGTVPRPLAVALPTGLGETQRTRLEAAAAGIDELTCCTIHSFCQRLIRPYPVDADTDPGAGIMAPVEVELQLNEAIDSWLREKLEEEHDGYLPELIWAHPDRTLTLVRTIVRHYHERRDLQPPDAEEFTAEIKAFSQSAQAFIEQVRQSPIKVADVLNIAKELEEIVRLTELSPDETEAAHLVRVLGMDLGGALATDKGDFRSFRHKTKYMNQAKLIGESKAVATDESDRATALYQTCAINWSSYGIYRQRRPERHHVRSQAHP